MRNTEFIRCRNVLYVNWGGFLGGAEIALLRFLRKLPRESYTPQVWMFQEGPFAGVLREASIPCRITPTAQLRNLLFPPGAILQMTAFLKKERIALVHANGTLAYLAAFLPCKLAGVPLLWHLVDRPEGKDPAERLAGKLTAGSILCNSRSTLDAFAVRYPQNHSPAEIIYPLVDFSMHPEEGKLELLRRELGIGPGERVVLCPGRFQKWKGQETLMRAAPRILFKHPSTHFIFLGESLPGMEDGSRDALLKTADETGLRECCHFPGFRKDPAAFYELADIVVHTSLTPEPFGLVVAEAMAAGRPVVATRGGGPAELITNESDGFLVPPGDPDALSTIVTRLLDDPELRSSVGSRGPAKVQTLLNPQKIISQTLSVYEKILAGKR